MNQILTIFIISFLSKLTTSFFQLSIVPYITFQSILIYIAKYINIHCKVYYITCPSNIIYFLPLTFSLWQG